MRNNKGQFVAGERAHPTTEFQKGMTPWNKGKRQQLRQRKAKLAARDGKKCFVHGDPRGFDELTIEHVLSFAHGGTDNDNNLILVCEEANRELGNLPVAKKIELIIEKRLQREQGFGTLAELGEPIEAELVHPRSFTDKILGRNK